MTTAHRSRWLMLALLLLPVHAAAQEPARSLSTINDLVHLGDQIRVVDQRDDTYEGTFGGLDATSLEVEVDGAPVKVLRQNVQTIGKRDLFWNAATFWIGTGAGFGIGYAVGAAGSENYGFPVGLFVGAPIGLGVGTVAQLFIHHYVTVYKEPNDHTRITWSLSPVVSGNAKGLGVRLQF